MKNSTSDKPLITPACFGIITIPSKTLLKKYRPVFISPMKAKLFTEAKEKFHRPKEDITISRWSTGSKFVEYFDSSAVQSAHISTGAPFYTYDDSTAGTDTRVWYVNFADPQLFGYYGSNLFAQDEIQTLEHPLLGSVAVFLDTEKPADMAPLTVEYNLPTPYLIEQVPYWLRVNTRPVLDTGETASIYGRCFSRADEATVRKGITLCEESVPHNIIAMAAPAGKNGIYTTKDIAFIMRTALAAFSAAVIRSRIIHQKSEEIICRKAIIHTGNWGSGAFGGNRELMTLLQAVSASLAGADTIVFHGVSDRTLTAVQETLAALAAARVHTVSDVISFTAMKHYVRGTGDGN